MKEFINSVIAKIKQSSTPVWSYIKIPLYILIALVVLYGIVYLAAGREKPTHNNKVLLQKIDSLQRVASQLQQTQATVLNNDVILRKSISKLQSQIDSIRGVKYIINNYYGARSSAVRSLQGKQVDSFFKQRYTY